MSILIDIIHILACISLILVVLMQAGKGAGMGAAFGGSSQTVFGSAGSATFLVKVTRILALVFIITSLVITILSSGSTTKSIMNNNPAPIQSEQEAQSTMPTVPIENGSSGNSQDSGNN